MLGVVLPTLVQRTGRTDLHILALASHRLVSGEPVYRLEDANEHTKPPLATLAFIPFSQIPLFWLERLWDVLNLVVYFCLLRVLFTQFRIPAAERFNYAMGTTIFFLTPLNSELRLGQYNVLLFFLMVGSLFRRRPLWTGVAASLAFLFKPTFVFVFPWLLRHTQNRISLFLGAAISLLGLASVYCLVWGPAAFFQDWATWSTFLPLSSAKHLLRCDNHGLPSALSAFFGGSWEKPLGLLGMAVSAWAAFQCRDGLYSLSVACVCLIVFSPMAWLQNYSLLLPVFLWVLQRRREAPPSEKAPYALALFILWVGIGALNPTTTQWLHADQWPVQRLPLWALVGALGIVGGIEARRRLRAASLAFPRPEQDNEAQ
jgi:hypothetical protein